MNVSACGVLLWALAACGRVGFDPVDSDGTGGNGSAGDDAGGLSDGGSPGDARADAISVACGTDLNCVSSGFSLGGGTTGSASSTTSFYSDMTQGSCGTSGGGDYGARFTVVQAGMYRFTLTAAFDTLLYALDGSDCSAPQLSCVDNPGTSGEEFVLALSAGQVIVVMVDSNSGCGNFSLAYGAL